MIKADAYRLDIKYADQVIGNLSLDNTTNLLKLSYSPLWQTEGFAISPIYHWIINTHQKSRTAF
ncbi:hypothetical protein ACNH6B_13705 [Shewanella basaltis]|uniref:hypothetical protein n=1 Tax=Shewanella basaltis TaxID=472183 RepID=UPI003AAFAFC9